MSYGDKEGAIAYLVGEPNRGLEFMFTMMNHARLNVGLEGVAVSEAAYQKAAGYARERVQGTPIGGTRPASIIHHPDVRRMLMDMRARTEAMRALAYCTPPAWTAHSIIRTPLNGPATTAVSNCSPRSSRDGAPRTRS